MPPLRTHAAKRGAHLLALAYFHHTCAVGPPDPGCRVRETDQLQENQISCHDGEKSVHITLKKGWHTVVHGLPVRLLARVLLTCVSQGVAQTKVLWPFVVSLQDYKVSICHSVEGE